MKEYQIDKDTTIRYARENEVPEILKLIREIADYENLAGEVKATETLLHQTLFEDQRAQVLFCEVKKQIVGFALFFYNFSTFVGKQGLYIEDLYLRPAMRGHGLGKAFFNVLRNIALENNCGRMEWVCLDRNQPAIDFYLHLGAKPMSNWTTYRITL